VTHPPRIARDVPKGTRPPNLRRKEQHLDFVRDLPCVACGRQVMMPIRNQAAHVRIGTDGGAGMKPSDRYTVPLCVVCHARQHKGELSFWAELRIDPLNVAFRLWTISGDQEAGERIVFRARQAIGLHK
jgi:hypothetical protein